MSHIHFLSTWFHPRSSGKNFVISGLSLANAMKSSTDKPSIYGTTATLTADRFTYYTIINENSYIFLSSYNLFQEVNINSINFW